jgi:hypothetical protein
MAGEWLLKIGLKRKREVCEVREAGERISLVLKRQSMT